MKKWFKKFRDDDESQPPATVTATRHTDNLDDALPYLCFFHDGGDNPQPAKSLPSEYGALMATGERHDPRHIEITSDDERNIQLEQEGVLKHCNYCDKYKRFDDFYTGDNFKSKHNPRGLFNLCKRCHNKRDYARRRKQRLVSKYVRYVNP